MPNEFVIKNGFRSQGNSEVTGSVSINSTSSTQVTLKNSGGGPEGISSIAGGTLAGFSPFTYNYTFGPLIANLTTLTLQFDGNDVFYGNASPGYIPQKNVIGFGNSPIYVDGLNNVGIGTSSPSAKLHVYGGNIKIEQGAGGDEQVLVSGGYLGQYNGINNEWGFAQNKIFINSSNQIGIGTLTPQAKLHVRGSGATSATEALRVTNTSDATLFKVLDNGGVTQGQNNTLLGPYSHAEGSLNRTGILGYNFTYNSGTPTEIVFDSSYGDVSSQYMFGGNVLISNIYGSTTVMGNLVSISFDGTNTIATLPEALPTFPLGVAIGFAQNPNPSGANVILSQYSHVEGLSNDAIGSYSHAEGQSNDAIGSYSHAEGALNKAVGVSSHAEGYQTVTSGSYSHSEGNNTITIDSYQHAQGQYNLAVTGAGAFILGNGIDDSNRSNLIFASGSQVQITGSTLLSGPSGSTLLQVSSPASSSILFVSGSGRVGFGNNTPTQRIDVDGNILLRLGESAASGRLYLRDTITYLYEGSGLNLVSGPTRNIKLNAGNADRLFVSASGLVGIGTSTPTHRLDVSGSARFKFSPSGADLFTIDGAATTRYFIVENGNGFVGIGSGYTTSTTPSTPVDIRGNTSIKGGSATIGNAFTITNFAPITLFTAQNNGQFAFNSPIISLATSQSAFTISQSISQSAVVGAQVYGVNITPTFFATTASQTETAFRVAATFTGSAAATAGNNIIADLGATSVGSQFTVTDVTSGSIYMVNDVSGLPILEATSDWTVNMYNFPNKIFEKTGSNVNIYGTLNATGSFILPLSQSSTPQVGSAYWSGSFLFIYDGAQYRSASFA